MLIILEGTDLSGKSTFIEMLRRHLPDLHVIHSIAPKRGEDPYEQYEHTVDKALAKHKHVVCDRLHWSEPVYAPIFNRKERLGIAGWRHIELFLAARLAQVVLFYPPEHELRRRYALRGDAHASLEQVLTAHRSYNDCPDQTILPYVITKVGSPEIARFVFQRGDMHMRSCAPITTVDSRYVGRVQPKVLLIGERRNERRDRSAFVPRASTSGRFLLEALSDDLWRHVGITNACEEDGVDLGEVHELCGSPPIVALGRAAHEATVLAGLPHSAVPHPQYVRRFLHGRLTEYGQLIQSVIGLNEDHLKWKGEVT